MPTAVAAGAVTVFFVSALVDHGEPAQLWPEHWFPLVFALLCTYLALRDRALVAWLILVAGMIIAQLLVAIELNAPETGPIQIATAGLVLVPATLIPRMVKLTTRGLPVALELSRNEATAMKTVSAQTNYLADSTAWVNAQISAALRPALAEVVRRRNAELLELRLRDSIRSPLFDDAAMTRAVWDTRAGGMTVSLLGDRAANEGSETQLQQLHAELIQALDHGLDDAPVDRVTARILPLGRDHYATVVVSGPDQVRRIVVACQTYLPE